MSTNFDELLKIMDKIRDLIDSPHTDTTWSSYRSVKEALIELDSIVEKVKQNEQSIIQELKILFAPTGAYQEISISSGWGNKFIEISSKFDDIIDSK